MTSGVAPPVGWAVSRWGSDPFSQGSWTGLLVGGSSADRAALAEPMTDRLVLAGEGVCPDQPAMVHGAYVSGLAAARVLVAAGHAGERVAVIGAGIAGLAAAGLLRDQDRRVRVFEARHRIGGRVHTVDLGAGITADLGAAWLEQYDRNPLADLARQQGLATVATDFTSPLAMSAQGPVSGAQQALAALARDAELLTRAGDLPLAAALAARAAILSDAGRRTLAYAVDAGVAPESGLDFSVASARGTFTEPGVGLGDRYLPTGMGQLSNVLARGFNVTLGAPVNEIVQAHDALVVSGPAGRITADRVVVAVPLAVLGSIRITAPMPAAHLDALSRIGTGQVEKVLLRYTDRWWPASPSGYLWWGEQTPTWTEWADLTDGLGAPVLSLIAAGDAARALHGTRPDAEIVADAHEAVVRLTRSFSG